jgi:hypothetical protein
MMIKMIIKAMHVALKDTVLIYPMEKINKLFLVCLDDIVASYFHVYMQLVGLYH